MLPLVFAWQLRPAQPTSVAAKVAWLADNASEIRSVNPREKDREDLRPLQRSIGDARLVLLGGSDGEATVKAKYRLVRFLHEEMGFDYVISFAPLFDAEELDRALDHGKLPRPDLLEWNALPFRFTRHGEPDGIVDLVDYIRATHKSVRPLHVAGFGRTVTPYMLSEYTRQLSQFLKRTAPKLDSPATLRAIQSLVALCSPTPSAAVSVWRNSLRWRDWDKKIHPGLEAVGKLYSALGHLPANTPNLREAIFYRETLANLDYYAARISPSEPLDQPLDSVVVLAQHWCPGSKIVVWSSNASVARNLPAPGSSNGAPRAALPTLGNAVAKEFGPAAYSLAFREIKDHNAVLEVLQAGAQPKLEPMESDLDSLIHAIGKPISFVDFRGLPRDHWLRKPLTARLTYGTEMSVWPENYDGLFTIDLLTVKEKK